MKGLLLATVAASAVAFPAYGQTANTPPVASLTEARSASAQASGSVSGQDAAADVDAGDVIVTANRRNQALSDVPVAVSAITAETLTNSGATDLRQLNQVSPSLFVSAGSSEAGAGAARIRGVGTLGENPGLESSVAVFIDGVYRSRTGAGLSELGQLDHVEVLRGPQGTLFGRNASAGLISVITALPEFTFGGSAQATYGNYNQARAELSLTGPVSETIAARLDGVYGRRDGFLKDVISGRRINDRDRFLTRGQLLFKPGSSLSLRLIGDYSQRNEECCGATYLGARNVTADGAGNILIQPSSILTLLRGLGATIDTAPYDRRISITPGRDYTQKVRDFGFSGELNYDFGSSSITAISAYRDFNFARGLDADYNNLDILYRASDGSARQQFRTFSQEIRFQGKTLNDRLDYLVGGYFAHENLNLRDNLGFGADYQRLSNCILFSAILPAAVQPTPTGQCVNVPVVQAVVAALPATNPNRGLLAALVANPVNPGFGSIGTILSPSAPLGLAGVYQRDVYRQTSRNFAFFTHNIVQIVPDRLSLTLGARYTNERKTLNAVFTDNNTYCRAVGASPFAGLQALPCIIPAVPNGSYGLNDGRVAEGKFSGTAVLSYKPLPELLTYVSYSRGYKAGGFNLDRTALARSVVNGAAGPVLSTSSLNNLRFAPETNNAYEIGAKLNLPGFDLNVAVFRQEFRNFQLNTFNGTAFEVSNVDACASDLGGADRDANSSTGACTGKLKPGVISQGVELEAFMRPARNFSVNMGFTLADAKYQNNLVGTNGVPLSATLFQLPGAPLSLSSRYVTTGSVQWTPPIGGGGLSALFYSDFRYQSAQNTGSDLDVEKIQPGIATVNARVGLRGPKNRWSIEFFAQNLLNQNFQQAAFDLPLQGGAVPASAASAGVGAVQRGLVGTSTQLFGAYLAEPRTYGLTLRTRF